LGKIVAKRVLLRFAQSWMQFGTFCSNVGIHLTQVTPTGCSFASVFRTIDA
jgi:hypothetical protein